MRAGAIRRTYPTISVVLFHELAIVVVVKCWVALHAFLFTELMVLSFGTVHRGVNNLRRNRKKLHDRKFFWIRKSPGAIYADHKHSATHH